MLFLIIAPDIYNSRISPHETTARLFYGVKEKFVLTLDSSHFCQGFVASTVILLFSFMNQISYFFFYNVLIIIIIIIFYHKYIFVKYLLLFYLHFLQSSTNLINIFIDQKPFLTHNNFWW